MEIQSPEKARTKIQKQLKSSQIKNEQITQLLNEVKKTEYYLRLKNAEGEFFETFEEFLISPLPYGLGNLEGREAEFVEKYFRRNTRVKIAAQRTDGLGLEHGGDRISEKWQENTLRTKEEQAKESGIARCTQFELDALARRRPELLEMIEAGKLSVNAAMIQAGLKKKRISIYVDPLLAATTIKKHFTEDQIARLAGFLMDDRYGG